MSAFDVYQPPDYTLEKLEAALLSQEPSSLQDLLNDLRDVRFRRHEIVQDVVIPPLCRAAVRITFLLDHEITSMHKLIFHCLIEIANEDIHIPHLLEDITAENNTKKLFRKLVDTVMYRKGVLQELACLLLAKISIKDCSKIRESTLPAFLRNLPKNKSSGSNFDRAVQIILVCKIRLLICLFNHAP